MIRLEPADYDFEDVLGRVNKVMDQVMQKSFFRFRPCERWQPAINVYETEEAYYICLDLAGVDPKQIELQADNKCLQITGHRAIPSPHAETNARIHTMEIDHGTFHRSVQMPANVDIDKIEARHRNGMVWIEMPKTK